MEGFTAGTGVVWEEIAALPGWSGRKKAAIAYFSAGSPISFKEGDTLVVDASPDVVRSGGTSVARLREAICLGADVRSFPGLHAKVIVLASTTLVVGSMNASGSSAGTGKTGLSEAALVTGREGDILKAEAWIDGLAKIADVLDEAVLDALMPFEKAAVRRAARELKGAGGAPRGERRIAPSVRLSERARSFYAMVNDRDPKGKDEKASDAEAGTIPLEEGFDSGWASFKKPTAALRGVEVGDELFLGWKERGVKEIDVWRGCVVRTKRRGRDGSLHLVFDYRLSDSAVAFDDFRDLVADARLSPRSQGKLIPFPAAEAARLGWKAAARR